MDILQYDTDKKTIDDLIRLYEDDKLDLEPGFQRLSVWTLNDRKKLIDSIIRGYPLPAVFFYKTNEEGDVRYYVIDGKQRIESILMFTGAIRGNQFDAKCQLPEEGSPTVINWKYLNKAKLQHLFTGYKVPIIEVGGDLSTIIELFVRINSTGKALTGQEKRHARYYRAGFLKEAAKQARHFEKYFRSQHIMSENQFTRMKHIELMSELILAAHTQDVSNKKAALDRIIEGDSITSTQLHDASKQATSAINKLKKVFPKLKTTRFTKVSDFYSLAVLIQKFQRERLVLNDAKQNKLAQEILIKLSNGVGEVRLQSKKAKGIKHGQELYRDYWATTQEGTDDIRNRRNREKILRGLLETLFKPKDKERLFTLEQRRLLWNRSEDPKCNVCRCKLKWEDFTVDHIFPHSRGGKTELKNAALLCKKHNSSKGNRV
ncbi:MAG: DUF262 domain-containing protein [Bacteroidetes bacterium]|nr:DUF262 domain-containing protein [Bacteroidota bacterium]